MSIPSIKNSLNGSNSSYKRLSTKDSLISKKSRSSGSFVSVHGSKFGRSVSKFPVQNDPSLVQTISITNSRVIRTITNFSINFNSKPPDLTKIEATDCIRELGGFLNILDYEFNFMSFWLLDVLAGILNEMQLKKFSVYDQNICFMWLRYVLRFISVNGASREEVFSLLQELFLSAEEIIRAEKRIPIPEEIENVKTETFNSSKSSIGSPKSQKSLSRKSSKKSTGKLSVISHRSSKTLSNKSLKSRSGSTSSQPDEEKIQSNYQNFCIIVEIIYKMFADRFMFTLINQAYSSPSIVTHVDIPIEFKEPKALRPKLIISPPPVSPKTKKSLSKKSSLKSEKSKKGKKKSKSSSLTKDETGTKGEGTEDKTQKEGKGGKGKKSKGSVTKEKKDSEKIQSKDKTKEGKGKKKSKPSKDSEITPEKEAMDDVNSEPNTKKEGKGGKGKKSKGSVTKEKEDSEKIQSKDKAKGGKGKKKSKPSKNLEIATEKEGMGDVKSAKGGKDKRKKSQKHKASEVNTSSRDSLERKLKLFDQDVSPGKALEMEKIRIKDQYILPLSEAVNDKYIEKLIKALLPPEIKQTEEKTTQNENIKGKRKSSSLKKKGKGSLKGNKKGKAKKK